MGQIEGPVLTALISFMYGSPTDIAVPLFVAADAHQANSYMCFRAKLRCIHPDSVSNLFPNVGGDALMDLSAMSTGSN